MCKMKKKKKKKKEFKVFYEQDQNLLGDYLF